MCGNGNGVVNDSGVGVDNAVAGVCCDPHVFVGMSDGGGHDGIEVWKFSFPPILCLNGRGTSYVLVP